MNTLLSEIQIWHIKLEKKGLITSTWTHNCVVMIKTKGATPDDCKYITINDEKDFYTAGLPTWK